MSIYTLIDGTSQIFINLPLFLPDPIFFRGPDMTTKFRQNVVDVVWNIGRGRGRGLRIRFDLGLGPMLGLGCGSGFGLAFGLGAGLCLRLGLCLGL